MEFVDPERLVEFELCFCGVPRVEAACDVYGLTDGCGLDKEDPSGDGADSEQVLDSADRGCDRFNDSIINHLNRDGAVRHHGSTKRFRCDEGSARFVAGVPSGFDREFLCSGQDWGFFDRSGDGTRDE